MNQRDNALAVLRKQKPEWVPISVSLCPSQLDELERRTGTRDALEFFQVPFRNIRINPSRSKVDFSRYFDALPPNASPHKLFPDWGVYTTPGSVQHFVELISPMENFESIEQINEYPFPDLSESYRWEGVKEQVEELKNKGFVATAEMQMTLFEISWHLRGLEKFLMDMLLEPEFALTLLDKVTDIRVKMAECYARAGVDLIQLGDDVSTQLDMMMSPQTWRDFLKPRLQKVIMAAKSVNPDVLVFYHGDGNLSCIIPDLIEVGIDILNPLQPECLDPYEVKRLYGDKLSFWGALGTQTTLPFGSVNDVKTECKKLIDNIGKGGGFVLAPTHVIEPEVPWENVMAFVNTVREYGPYIP